MFPHPPLEGQRRLPSVQEMLQCAKELIRPRLRVDGFRPNCSTVQLTIGTYNMGNCNRGRVDSYQWLRESPHVLQQTGRVTVPTRFDMAQDQGYEHLPPMVLELLAGTPAHIVCCVEAGELHRATYRQYLYQAGWKLVSSQCQNMAVLVRRTKLPSSQPEVPDFPIVSVLKDVSATNGQVIPAPCCWVGGKVETTSLPEQNARADVVYMIVQVTWGTTTSVEDGTETSDGPVLRAGTNCVRVCVYHIDNQACNTKAYTIRRQLAGMLYDCWLHQCDFCGGDANGAAYRWQGGQFYPNVRLSMLSAMSQVLVNALAHVQGQLVNTIPMAATDHPEREKARALIAMAVGRPHVPWHLDNSIATIETLERLYTEDRWTDPSNPGVDCIACSVWSWYFASPVFQESCRTITEWPQALLDSDRPFDPFRPELFQRWGDDLKNGYAHHYEQAECIYAIKDSPYMFLLSNIRLFLKPNDHDWHTPIRLNIRMRNQQHRRQRTEYARSIHEDLRLLRYLLDAYRNNINWNPNMRTLEDLPGRFLKQLGVGLKQDHKRYFTLSEDKMRFMITHAGRVAVMHLYEKHRIILNRVYLPQELRMIDDLIEEVERDRQQALVQAADDRVQRASQPPPRGTRSKTKAKAKG